MGKTLIPSPSLLIKYRILAACIVIWTILFALYVSALASNQWVVGRTSYYGKKPTVSVGLFKVCRLDRNGNEKKCESYSSTTWIDFTKALIFICLIFQLFFIPFAYGVIKGEADLNDQRSLLIGTYRVSFFIAGPILCGAIRTFINAYATYSFLRGMEYGSGFFTLCGTIGFSFILPILYYMFAKFCPVTLGISGDDESPPEVVVDSKEDDVFVEEQKKDAGSKDVEMGIAHTNLAKGNDTQVPDYPPPEYQSVPLESPKSATPT